MMEILERMETILDTMRVYCDQVRSDLRMSMHIRRTTIDAMELFMQEKEDSRQRVIAERLKARAEKDIGPWFWRRRKGVSIEDDLRDRVKQLRQMGYNLDWQWDLVYETYHDWTGGDVDEDLLKRVFLEAHNVTTG